jgi:hypothetical protein
MSESSQPHGPPLTPEEWEAKFIRTLKSRDFKPYHDTLIIQLLADSDTLNRVARFVHWYVSDCWEKWIHNRAKRGEGVNNLLKKAVAGQEVTIQVFEEFIAGLDDAQIAGADCLDPLPRYLDMSRQLLAKVAGMLANVSRAYNSKPLGYKGDLQTLDALDWLLQVRLGKSTSETLFTLIDCGNWVEGQKKQRMLKDPVADLRKRLRDFRANNPLAQRTEAFVRSIPRK